jgi:cysteine desulfuration protein SufE
LHQIAAPIYCFVAHSSSADDSICWENARVEQSLHKTALAQALGLCGGAAAGHIRPMTIITQQTDSRLEELAETFDFLDDWESRYRHVIGLGRLLAPLEESERVEASKIRGCASQVWLVSEVEAATGHLKFRGQSDASIVQGLLAVLLELYSDRPAAQIVALDPNAAMARLGFMEALTPQRSNGLAAMATRIQEVARDHLPAA